MKKGSWRLLGGLALAGGLVGAVGAALMKKNNSRRDRGRDKSRDQWARPGMNVVFRAEVMPGRDRAERTFRVVELLPSGRVTLDNVAGEHAEKEFEVPRY